MSMTLLTTIISVLIPILTPMLTGVIRSLFGQLPKGSLPVVATLLGAGLEVVNGLIGGSLPTGASVAYGAEAGLAGVGLYELGKGQLKNK